MEPGIGKNPCGIRKYNLQDRIISKPGYSIGSRMTGKRVRDDYFSRSERKMYLIINNLFNYYGNYTAAEKLAVPASPSKAGDETGFPYSTERQI